ncbi:uncharacterized protein LOC110944154 [Helianthus annuus]|uniref:uncharacterized protein LOC110944154 n=1 Tax=Helianthus annuus TaxID=4232 RepID=UPI000B8F0636|nr:uncharacterized protein LOC110944154 [Helianthus annuus]
MDDVAKPDTPLSPGQSSETAKLHPASTVTNIKNLIPILLDMETGQYLSWSELFRIQCRAFKVIDHLKPKPAATSSTSENPPVDEEWDRLDAIVLQWIYSTISNDLLNTIIRPGNTAYDAWSTLEGLFQDNKNARAIHLMQRFTTTRLDGFPNMSAYCQAIKSLADQLANVGAPLDNKRLVLHLLAGLTDQYEGISTILQQKDPTPTFYEARSQLCLIESQKAEKALYAATTANQALNTTTNRSTSQSPSPPTYQSDQTPTRGRGRSRGRGRGRFSGSRGRGQQYGQWTSPTTYTWTVPTATNGAGTSPTPWLQWAAPPPCPYPTTAIPPPHNSAQGILGPRPHQGHQATYSPTDIQQALYTMSLHPPEYQHGVMDTGATISMDPNSVWFSCEGLQDPDPHNPVRQQR